jgi:Uma2 family endonuclease
MDLAPGLISVADYFKQEETSHTRHEYLGGQLFAMAGSSEEHNRIAGNIYAPLLAHLRGSGCKTFISDIKVKIQVAQGTVDIFYYPDVMVTCDEEDREKFYKTHPCLVVEVLSPSTETIDRREKRLNYQSLASLQEYVLVSQNQMQVEVYRRNASGNWEVERLGPNDSLELNSVGLTLTLAEIYDEVFDG